MVYGPLPGQYPYSERIRPFSPPLLPSLATNQDCSRKKCLRVTVGASHRQGRSPIALLLHVSVNGGHVVMKLGTESAKRSLGAKEGGWTLTPGVDLQTLRNPPLRNQPRSMLPPWSASFRSLTKKKEQVFKLQSERTKAPIVASHIKGPGKIVRSRGGSQKLEKNDPAVGNHLFVRHNLEVVGLTLW